MSKVHGNIIRSPSYPAMPLQEAVDAVAKIERQYRSSPVDREVAVKLLGYKVLSGPAAKTLAALASYGLLERAGKGETRVTSRSRAILHASNDQERRDNLLAAALEPDLFRELRERFAGVPIPPEDGVVTYLNRQGFNPTAIGPATKAFLQTMTYIGELGTDESQEIKSSDDAESSQTNSNQPMASVEVKVGDFIQWKSHGVLQFPQPRRVRMVSNDNQWVVVEGNQTGIPTNEVIVEKSAQAQKLPIFDLEEQSNQSGFEEWFRAKVGAGKQVQILYRGDGDIGAREIQKLIDILAAQKSVLED